jgi:DNA-binding NtrC family response regulator
MATVLIVEDEEGILRTLMDFLEAKGHDVHGAPDAESGLCLFEIVAPDVVVTDILLPRMSGIELLRRIKERAPETQVITMTGQPTNETAAQASAWGASEYLAKPFRRDVIIRAVEASLASRPAMVG